MIDLIFFGTDEFSTATLEVLVRNQDFKIVLVVTQPDRPTGRKQEVVQPPVKMMAEKYGLQVMQPETLKDIALGSSPTPTPTKRGLATTTYHLPPTDLNIVYRYGLIIPQNILSLPTHGTINIHPSMLPKYRGPSPIQTAIMNGDTETGITVMLMDEAMDHGPILAQEIFPIAPDDTYQTLSSKMTPKVNELLLTTIPHFLSGEIKPTPQNNAEATFSKILGRDDGKIDWNQSATEIYNQYRALTPWPGVWTMWGGKRLKLITITPSPFRRGTPGEVSITDEKIYIASGEESIEVLELQLEGKKVMDAKAFLSGYKNINGTNLE